MVVAVLLGLSFTFGFWVSYNLTRFQMEVIRKTYDKQLAAAVDYLATKKAITMKNK